MSETNYYFAGGGGHQSVEQSPQRAGVAAELWRTPGTPGISPV